MKPINGEVARRNIPHDLVVDVLLRLPIKSLGQFKCVSKSWCSSISDPQFAKLHLNRALSVPKSNPFRILGLCSYATLKATCYSLDYESTLPKNDVDDDAFDDDDDDDVYVDVPAVDLGYIPFMTDENFHMDFLGSCNGLVCVVYYDPLETIILWNPSTRAFRKLPEPPTSFSKEYRLCHGFGYDSSTDDYTVLRVPYSASADEYLIKAFYLKDDSWRIFQGTHRNTIIFRHRLATCTTGAVHWAACRFTGSPLYDKFVLSFDLAEKKVREILLPCTEGGKEFYPLVDMRGCLSVLASDGEHVEVWVMKEYNVIGSWTKFRRLPVAASSPIPLCLTKSRELIVLDGDDTSRVMKFNLRLKSQ